MIPAFPEFKPLALDDRPFFGGLLARLDPLCSEYTFTNLFGWRGAWHYRVTRYGGGCLVLRERDGVPSFLQPLVPDGHADAVRACLDYLQSHGAPPVIARVGEEFAAHPSFDRAAFVLEEARDDFDYVYSVPALVDLRGPGFHKKKNLVNQFRRQNRHRYLPLTRGLRAGAIRFQHEWYEARECFRDEGLSHEQTAIVEMLMLFDGDRLRGGVIEIGGRIAALALGERLNRDTLVIHVEKGRAGIPGISQAINQEFLAREGGPFAFVNREQDLGVEGLRKAKLSYKPVRMVKKYSIRPRA